MEDLLERRRMLMQQSASVDPYLLQPFTITVLSGSGVFAIAFKDNPYDYEYLLHDVYFNLNNTGWVAGAIDEEAGAWKVDNDYIALTEGDVLQIKGVGAWSISGSTYYYLEVSGGTQTTLRLSFSGNINSLVHGDNYLTATTLPSYCFCNFTGENTLQGIATALVDASKLRLPATTIGMYAYRWMFKYSLQLTDAPEIISAVDLGMYSMHSMFQDCPRLINPPKELPAINMAARCYFNMFRGCSKLIKSPDIPNVNWNGATSPMGNMFRNCYKLGYVKAMFTQLSSDGTEVTTWMSGVPSNGIFVKNSAATWDIVGDSGVPSGWTIQYASS